MAIYPSVIVDEPPPNAQNAYFNKKSALSCKII